MTVVFFNPSTHSCVIRKWSFEHSHASTCSSVQKAWQSLYSSSSFPADLLGWVWCSSLSAEGQQASRVLLTIPHPHFHQPPCGRRWACLCENMSVCELCGGTEYPSCSVCHGFDSRAEPTVLPAPVECTEQTWCSLQLLERCSRFPAQKKAEQLEFKQTLMFYSFFL